MKELYKNILDSVETDRTQNVNRHKNSRVLIIDGLNTFIRCWSSIPTMNEDGDHVGGATGVLKSIGYAIRQTQPSRVVVVFDGKGGSTSRKKKFSGYKAQRDSNKLRVNRQYKDLMNDEDERESMKRQFVWLNEMLDGLPLTTMIYDGVEADEEVLECGLEGYYNPYPDGIVFCSPGNGYWGRDHGNDNGIPPDGFERTLHGSYPAGGVFDNREPSPQKNGAGAGGAGIHL